MTDPTIEAESQLALSPDSVVELHRLAVRLDDDDEDTSVVGRAEIGEFIELPTAAAEAISLLGDGRPLGDTEEAIQHRHGVRLDIAELVETLVELGFVVSVDGKRLSTPAGHHPGEHLPWLEERRVRWLFSRPVGALWTLIVVAAALTWSVDPSTLPTANDFFWSPFVGLVVLVNTVMLSVHLSVHELMHLAAARSYGAPARISFATRLHHLVVQTDVTAVWAVSRRLRYRVYLAGMFWDSLVISVCTLLIAHAGLPPGA
ncbi:MAG: hypothetical protein ACRD0H_04090, partial [Actinomycetes bacterium]